MDGESEMVLKKFRKSDLELISDILDKDILDTGLPIYGEGEKDDSLFNP